jgi:hypothetical protein
MTTPTSAVRSAASLDALLAVLREHGADLPEREWTRLPTFGGEEPRSTSGVWSWDESRMLVGTCASDVRIVARCSEGGCGRAVYARGLCLPHYSQTYRAEKDNRPVALKPIRGDAPALVAVSLRVTPEVKDAVQQDPDGARRALEAWLRS